MLGLITLDDIDYVLNQSDDPDDLFLSGEPRRFAEVYRKRPGFFQPYQDAKEFAGGVLAPIVYPLGFAALGIMGFIAGVASPLAGAGCRITAMFAEQFGNVTLFHSAFNIASACLYFTGFALMIAAASIVLAVLSFPCSLLTLATRSLATAGAELLECMNDSDTTTEAQTSMLI